MEEIYPKISVIVPVYNAASYLEVCIQSILDQTLKEIEIILINDGSTDDSLSIIQKFKKKDSRIKIINQINKGPGASRNAGIKIANGEYIGFVDADDTVEKEMFEKLFIAIKKNSCDFAICNINVHYPDQTIKTRLSIGDKIINLNDSKEIEILNILKFKYDYGNWNKIFSKKILNSLNIRFAEGIMKGEDLMFNIYYFLHSNKGICINENLYNYYIRTDSITQNKNISFVDEFKKVSAFFHNIKEVKKSPTLCQIFDKEISKICFYELVRTIRWISINEPNAYHEIKKQVKTYLSFNNPNFVVNHKQNLIGKIRLWSIKNSHIRILLNIEKLAIQRNNKINA